MRMNAHIPKVEVIHKGKSKERHLCDRPVLGAEIGEIVKLPCGHYWHMCWQDGGIVISPGWGRVRFWNLLALWRIFRS